ncbi:MAG: toll/interleukin-1 receptor domain-containing protein [Hyphomonadaceae bacterium]|nr:toll/interleukin-1 receptor domain-containing protein [Hyphomonadaceae bacterium]
MDTELLLFIFGVAAASALSIAFAFLSRRLPNPPLKILAAAILSGIFGFACFWALGASTYILTGTNAVAVPVGIAAGLVGALVIFMIVLRKAGQIQTQSTGRRARPRTTQRKQAPEPSRPRIAPDVFISYKRDERAEVLNLAQRLQALKLTVWFDADLRSGTSFDSEIDWNIRRAKCVLVCWSPGAATSDWVRGEATIGREREVLAAAMLKPSSLPAPFNLVHAEDLTLGINPENPSWIHLLERIGQLVGRPGLGAFEAASARGDRAAIAAWMADHPHDPLFDQATALLKSI